MWWSLSFSLGNNIVKEHDLVMKPIPHVCSRIDLSHSTFLGWSHMSPTWFLHFAFAKLKPFLSCIFLIQEGFSAHFMLTTPLMLHPALISHPAPQIASICSCFTIGKCSWQPLEQIFLQRVFLDCDSFSVHDIFFTGDLFS